MKLKGFNFILFILIILVILLIIFFKYNKSNYSQQSFFKNKIATVILTKGYDNNEKYSDLIKRNQSIYDKFYDKSIDNIIFHEGNITQNQQKYIQNKTPNLPLLFYKIDFIKQYTPNTLCPSTKESDSFSIGYKNMCYFWSIGFLNNQYLKNYDYIFRIDEDCILNKIDKNIFNNYFKNNIYFSSPYFQGEDSPNVTVGMNTFFNNYIKTINFKPYNINVKNPYTNVFIMNIKYFRNNKIIQQLFKNINLTNCIFNNRWGDLPIWGYILYYFIDPK